MGVLSSKIESKKQYSENIVPSWNLAAHENWMKINLLYGAAVGAKMKKLVVLWH